MMNWFGPESWGAPINDDCPRCDVPIGVTCQRCERAIAESDSGVTMPGAAFHFDCWLKSIVPHVLWPAHRLEPDDFDGAVNGTFVCFACGMAFSREHGWHPFEQSYAIEVVADRTAIRCLLCDRISELAGDVENRYCGRCHLFHDIVTQARVAHALGATHDCGEWRTWPHACAVCGAALEKPSEDR